MSDKKVILDYAQELQTNDEPWREFALFNACTGCWQPCTEDLNPLILSRIQYTFRRKPKTITVTMPVPETLIKSCLMPCGSEGMNVVFASTADRDTALAAIREAMGGGE